MNRMLQISMVLVCSVLLLTCKKDESAPTQTPTTGTIQGQVTNETGDTVIVNAIITTSPATSSVSTNTQGSYTIPNVSPGQYTVTAAKGGYNSGSVAIAVLAGQTTTANIHLSYVAIPPVPTQGLIAYYPFNGNANDESGNGHNGTTTGATPATDRFGTTNRAYGFDGVDDYIRIPDHSSLMLPNDLTINAWIYSDGCTSPCDPPGYHSIINKRDDQVVDSYWSWNFSISYINGVGGNEFRKLFTGRRNPPGVTDYKLSNIEINILTWQMVTVTVKSDTVKFFIDGVEAGTTLQGGNVFSIPAINQPVDVLIGWNRKIDYKEQFKGNIDDIRIYNRSLSITEIQQLFHEGGW